MAEDAIVSDPEILGGLPVIKGTRVPVYDLAASVQAGIPRDRILAAYPSIKEYHLDLAVSYAEANPLKWQPRKGPPVANGTLVKSGTFRGRRDDN
jgi:uncharacterized protein (DUF433 family)